MAEHNITNLPDAIAGLEDIKAVIEKINTENLITIVHHRNKLRGMVTACNSLIDNIVIIERDLRAS
ncbi:hypothetical protein LCGC14_0771570 [marine sediment metagenome]|uniref:Uncharacterized protein n=1 Tax=marine sediment metagenome TaxID=412755 RepID=A0A0F9Q2A4_9ZZZZ